jgi:outer membrane biogenesis lipoprotein LolB
MKAKKKPIHPLLLLMTGAVLLAGCAHMMPPPQDDFRARQILENLVHSNIALLRYKALAHIRMESEDGVLSGRVAMAAVFPHQLRVEWLNIMGQPSTSIAGDGQTISIWSSTDHKLHHLRQSPKALAKLIKIPLGIEDFQNIVIGRPPVPADTVVQLKEVDNDTDLLVLKNRKHQEAATIRVDRSTDRIVAMRTFDSHGQLLYEARWLQWRQQCQYLVPSKIVFESGSGQRLDVNIDRFWPDVVVPSSTFELQPPKNG